jgi:hypothetical protein
MSVAAELPKGLEMASEADLHTGKVPQGNPVSNEGPDTEQGMAGARSPSKISASEANENASAGSRRKCPNKSTVLSLLLHWLTE